jgi:hypothetical protein
MALEDQVYISTNAKPEQALQQLFDINGIDTRVTLEGLDPSISLYFARREGYIIYAYSVSERMRHHFTSEFGITPTVHLKFRYDNMVNITHLEDELVKMIFKLLDHTDNDIALIFLDALFVLVRKSGQILLNSRIGFWTQDNLKLITFPYTLVNIPNL